MGATKFWLKIRVKDINFKIYRDPKITVANEYMLNEIHAWLSLAIPTAGGIKNQIRTRPVDSVFC